MAVEVILTNNVQGLGRAGEVVRVSPGYARNFLMPRDLAIHATDANRRRFDAQLRVRAARMTQEIDEARNSARRIEGIVCIIAANAGENGRLFGSVTANDIADNLATKGIPIDRRRIELEEGIRKLGVYPVSVRLHPEVVATIQVEVIPNEA